MARPRSGIGFEQRGVWYTGVRLRNGKRWVIPCESLGAPPNGFAIGENYAKLLSLKFQARYDAGTWDPAEVAQSKGESVAPTLTVEAWCKRWLASQTYDYRTQDERILDRYLRGTALATRELASVGRADLRDFAAVLRATNRAPRTLRNAWDVVRRALVEAHRESLCPLVPEMPRDALPAIRDANREWRDGAVFSREELTVLLASPKLTMDRRVLYTVLALTGARLGEVLALRWRHWNPTREPLGELRIATSYQRISGGEKCTKTGASRQVPVHPSLAEVLGAWRASTDLEALLGRAPNEDDLIVPTADTSRTDSHRTHHAAYQGLQEDLRRLELRRRRVHDLRRTFISLCRDDGARVEVLRWVTHGRSASMTDVYSTLAWSTFCTEVGRLKLPLEGFVTGFVTKGGAEGEKLLNTSVSLVEAPGVEPDQLSRDVAKLHETRGGRKAPRQLETVSGRFVTGFVTDVTELAKAVLQGHRPDEAAEALARVMLDPAVLKHARGVLRAQGLRRVQLGRELASVVLGETGVEGE